MVLLVDEAHLLSPAQLEELRLLTNAEMDSQSPFAGILLGQPTLAQAAADGIVRRARSTDRAALRAGRHERAGDGRATSATTCSSPAARTTLFSDDAIELLHRTSRGIPRQLNNLASQALIACYASSRKRPST